MRRHPARKLGIDWWSAYAVRDVWDWVEKAACRGVDPDVMVPWVPRGSNGSEADQAKSICATCPVRQPCLDAALERPALKGVWGGTSEAERRAIRKMRRTA